MQVNMHEAKIKLFQLVELAASGEEVIITKSGKPTVKLILYRPGKKRIFGQFKGLFTPQKTLIHIMLMKNNRCFWHAN
jgi:prevent-host-death family protein